jgi:branched-chain amino acid transport system ATP-binding protein
MLLSIDRVVAGYDEETVLRGVSLQVPMQGAVALIGPNGHGKSTLLRCISGLVRATSGDITFDGRRLNDLPVAEIVTAGITHIPQGDMIFAQLTVLDNLLMGAHLPAARAHIADNLERVYALLPQLEGRQAQVATTLSGGERRMLAIGRGLMTGGRLFLIDEPSLGLAPKVIEEIYGVLHSLVEEGCNILLVEENASRAAELADQLYLLDGGAIVWQGSRENLEANEELIETYLGG